MRILYVCTGNTCRSAMSEIITRRLLQERGLQDFSVSSAGTAAWEGAPASDGALLVALEHAMDLSGHRAQALTRELMDNHDLVLVMGPHHRERAEAMGGKGKTHLLTNFASRGGVSKPVVDPFGGELEQYRQTYEELEREIGLVLDRIAQERTPHSQ